MPDWLTEGDSTLYLVLAAAEVVLLALWWRTRKRWYAVAAAGVATIALLLFILDWAVESDREQVKRKLHEMAAAVAAGHMDAIFSHISRDFRYGSVGKSEFRQFCDANRRSRNVSRMAVWDIQFGDVYRTDRRAEVEFRFKVEGNWSAGEATFDSKSEFRLDSDAQWRLRTFKVYNPIVDKNQPLSVPGLGTNQ